MPETSYTIRKLENTDSSQNFKLGNKALLPLKTFLQKQAKQFQQSSIAQTYVAVTDDKSIVGYVSLTCSEIDLENGYELNDCAQANNYSFLPAVKIARLAVDNRYRGQSIGQNLVNFSLALVLDSIASNVGCRFIVTDAKKDAVGFYEKQGFVLVNSENNLQSECPVMFLDLANLP